MGMGKREAIIRATNMKYDYYARGFSYQDLANKYKISRTMAHKIVNRDTIWGTPLKDMKGIL